MPAKQYKHRIKGDVNSFTLFSAVLWGPGPASGASDHGTGAAGECSGSLSPGCHALPPGLLPGQECRYVLIGWSSGIVHKGRVSPDVLEGLYRSEVNHPGNLLLNWSVLLFSSLVYLCPLLDELPYLKCPLHSVLKLTPVAYGEKYTHTHTQTRTHARKH